MQIKSFKLAAVALMAPGLALAAPVAAAPGFAQAQTPATTYAPAQADVAADHHRGRDRRWKRGRGHRDNYRNDYRGDRRGNYRNYDEPVYRDTRVWRGDDGQYYCRKENGTTGLLIGAAVGGLIGNEVAGRGDKTLGAILGAAGGAILGRTIDRSNSRCR